jgi:hypothetical protein
MKTPLTGAAQSVTNTNERVRKLFENRPFNPPASHQQKHLIFGKRQPATTAQKVQDSTPSQVKSPK